MFHPLYLYFQVNVLYNYYQPISVNNFYHIETLYGFILSLSWVFSVTSFILSLWFTSEVGEPIVRLLFIFPLLCWSRTSFLGKTMRGWCFQEVQCQLQEIFCEKIFQFLTVIFFYCLISIFFIMLLLQEKSPFWGEGLLLEEGSKLFFELEGELPQKKWRGF